MNDAALRFALSEPRLDALSELWAEMGRLHNDNNTAGEPVIVFPWPTRPPPRPPDTLKPLESIDKATLG